MLYTSWSQLAAIQRSWQLSPCYPFNCHRRPSPQQPMHKKEHLAPLHAECHDRCVLRGTKTHYFSPGTFNVLPGVCKFSLVHSCSPWDVHALLGTLCGPQTQRDTGPSPMLPYRFQSLSPVLKHCNGSIFSFTQRHNNWDKLVWSVVLSSNRKVSSTPAEAWLISPRVISRLLVFLLQIAERDDQPIDEQREDLVERVHEAALHPLGDGDSRVGEAQLLQDVVSPNRVDLRAGPVEESASRS